MHSQAHLKSSAISCDVGDSLPRLSSTRRLTHFIRHTLAWPRLTVKTCFCRLREIQQALGARKRLKSCFFGQRLWLRAFSHQTFTMSVIIQMEFSCIEKNTVLGIRLIGQNIRPIKSRSLRSCSEPGGAASMPPQILGPGGTSPSPLLGAPCSRRNKLCLFCILGIKGYFCFSTLPRGKVALKCEIPKTQVVQ